MFWVSRDFLVLPGVRNIERLRTTGIDQCISTKGPRTSRGFILRVMAGGPLSKKIGHRGSAGEKRLRTTALSHIERFMNLEQGFVYLGFSGPALIAQHPKGVSHST